MIKSIIDLILHNQNQFASGGLLLMAIGAIGASLRKVPASIYQWFLRRTTLMVNFTEDSKFFPWFMRWFQAHPFCQRLRDVNVKHTNGKPLFLPTPGTHWFWHQGKAMRLTYSRSEQGNGYDNKRSESIQLRIFGHDRKFLKSFIEEIQRFNERHSKNALYNWNSDYWQQIDSYSPRSLDSVVIPGVKDEIVKDIKKFINKEEWYRQNGIPFHRGFLLHGLPGTGKTSLVQAIANHFGMPINFVNLNEMNDTGLRRAMLEVDPWSIVLLEDIDCMDAGSGTDTRQKKKSRWVRVRGKTNQMRLKVGEDEDDKKKPMGVSLSGLLNSLDGVSAPHGVIYFLTSNKINKIDPAMLRPGRVDRQFEFGYATNEQKEILYSRLTGHQPPLDILQKNMTMAEVQQRGQLDHAKEA